MGHAPTIDGVARCEIVRTIEHYVRVRDLPRQRVADQPRRDHVNRHGRICFADAPRRRLRFVDTNRVFAMNNLALEIGEIHNVAISDADMRDTGGRQIK